MTDGFSYGGYTPHPYWLCPPYQHPSVSTPPFLATPPPSTSSYVQTFDPMIPPSFYHRSPSYGDNSHSPTPPPSSSSNAQPGDLGHGGEDSCKDKFSSSQSGYYPSMETPSSGVVYCPPIERQRVPPYSSATVSSLADMLIRNSPEPFYVPIPPSGVCATSNAFNYGTRESLNAAVSGPPYLRVPPYMPMSSFQTDSSFGGSQTGFHLGEGRSFGDNFSTHPPVFIHQFGGSVEPVFGYGGEASSTGHVKPLSENPDLRDGTVDSRSPRSDAESSVYQRPDTVVADSGNGVSGSSSKNAIGDLNFDEQHESWNQFVVASEGAVKADNRNDARSAVSYETHSEGSANQPSEDVQAKTCKVQEQYDKKSPVCDQGDFTSPGSSTRVSSVVNALHDLSEVLVYECFSYRSLLKPEQLEKIVENLTKCLKKITGDKALAGEASVPTQVTHVSCPNVVDLNEAPDVVAKDCQGFNVKPVDSLGFKDSVDKDEMTKSIKNMLASNFPDGEENHPQTLLYKNLWLETEAALCSTTCLARYHRIKNETEISADASTLMQDPCLNPQKSVSIINSVVQETAEPLMKDGSTFGNNVVAMSHDAPQSSRFNTAPVEAVLSLMSPASTTEETHSDVIDRFQILKNQETKRKLKSQNCSDPGIGVIDRFQILEHQETTCKLKSQDLSETRMDEQEEDNPDASELATTGSRSHMSDVMGRFQMLKRREAEKVQKSLNIVDFDSDSDSDFESDSDSDQSRNETQRCDYLWSVPMMTIGGNSQIETCANTEPSADGKGYESPTSDWEHVLKED
ncbi:hypothetical protein HA466_0113750 [Hirschfeldia incana]|nr:hypothetical protein HA466_0113750 [Hirschfeldia incana]